MHAQQPRATVLAVFVPAPKAIQRAVESILKHAASVHVGEEIDQWSGLRQLTRPLDGTNAAAMPRHSHQGRTERTSCRARESLRRSEFPSALALAERQHQFRADVSTDAACCMRQLGLATLGARAECHRAESVMRAAGSRTTLRFLLNRDHSGSFVTKQSDGQALDQPSSPPAAPDGYIHPSVCGTEVDRTIAQVQNRSLEPLPSHVKRRVRNVCLQSATA